MILDRLGIPVWIGLVEFAGALLIAGFAFAAVVRLATGAPIEVARLLVIEGTLAGLNFKLAATLLRTLQIHTWAEIGSFTAVLALRTVIKQVLTWERGKLGAVPDWPAKDAAGRAARRAS